MDKIHSILSNLRDGIPQALARFNDGEMTGIIRPGSVVARGDQQVPKDLSDKLKEALQHEQDNYWVGIPCSVCYPNLHSAALSYVDDEYDYLTKAVVTTNRNWKLFTEEFTKIMKDKIVRWIGNTEHDVTKLSFNTLHAIRLPAKEAWSLERLKISLDYMTDPKMPKGSIWLLSCGPMARVLVYQAFKSRPDCTFLDVGSCFDPWTRNKRFRCHQGTLPPCKECN